MLNGLDLFSGIGGLTLALAPWVRPVAYCEQDRYAQSVLLSRMGDGSLPLAPIWDDVQTLSAELVGGPIDIVYGGFPCQDISVAGTGRGLDGGRSGLFFQITRLIGNLRPGFVFLENSPAIAVRGLDRVLLELTALGYDCRWTIVSAAEMGAVHRRERWWLLAHANGIGSGNQRETMGRGDEFLGERDSESLHAGDKRNVAGTPEGFTSPRVGGTGDGLSNRMDRLRGLGNAVVPLQAREAFKRLAGITQTC